MTNPSQGVQQMRNETPMDHLKLVRRYYVAWNRGDLAEIEACTAIHLQGHAGAQSFDRAALISFRRQISNAFADFRVHEEDAIAQHDKVVMRWISRGLARDGDEPVETRGVTIYRIESGKIVEMWDVRDQPAMSIG